MLFRRPVVPAKLTRRALFGLALIGDAAIYAYGNDSGNDAAVTVLFVAVSLLAGLSIDRWWAVMVCFGCVAMAAIVPTGTEDTRGFLIFAAGIIPALLQATLVSMTIGARRVSRKWFARTKPQCWRRQASFRADH